MARNDEIEAGAKAIVKDLRLPGGRQKKLARVLARHLDWFDAAEAHDMTWDDMIATLTAAGARRKNGLPLVRGSLSSAVWRKRKEAAAAALRQEGQPERDPTFAPGETRKPGSRRHKSENQTKAGRATNHSAAAVVGARARKTVREDAGGAVAAKGNNRNQQKPSRGRLAGERNGSEPKRPGVANEPAPSNGNVRAYMRRAMRLRGQQEEDD